MENSNSDIHRVPVQNRFSPLVARENGECFGNKETFTNHETPNVSRENFASSSMDSKLLLMFDELRFIRQEQVSGSLAVTRFQQQMCGLNDKLNQVIQVTNFQTDFMKSIAYKSIDMEARSRRNNLVFRGFLENTGEDCIQLIRDFLQNRLAIDSRHIYIARAHRLGRLAPNRRYQSRPIIVNFRDYGDTELIMGKVRMLKGTPFSVDFDFPREIQEARGRLWSRLKQLRHENPRSKVQIVYPAKLLQDGRLVHDELPEWNRYVGSNRLSMLNDVGPIKSQRPVVAPGNGHEVSTTSQLFVSQSHSQYEQGPEVLIVERPRVPADSLSLAAQRQNVATQGHAESNIGSTSIPQNVSSVITTNTSIQVLESERSPSQGCNSSVVQAKCTDTCVKPSQCEMFTESVELRENTIHVSSQPISEETSVKSLQCDATNPKCVTLNIDVRSLCDTQIHQCDETEPSRGRSRVSRSVARSQKRSLSAVPYRRQSGSYTRDNKRVLPAPKNSNKTKSDRVQPVETAQTQTAGKTTTSSDARESPGINLTSVDTDTNM